MNTELHTRPTSDYAFDRFSEVDRQLLDRVFEACPFVGAAFQKYLHMPAGSNKAELVNSAVAVRRADFWRNQGVVSISPETIPSLQQRMSVEQMMNVTPHTPEDTQLLRMMTKAMLPELILGDGSELPALATEQRKRLEILAVEAIVHDMPKAKDILDTSREYIAQESPLAKRASDVLALQRMHDALMFEASHSGPVGLFNRMAAQANDKISTHMGQNAYRGILAMARQSGLAVDAALEPTGRSPV